jgi:hypothetical protein
MREMETFVRCSINSCLELLSVGLYISLDYSRGDSYKCLLLSSFHLSTRVLLGRRKRHLYIFACFVSASYKESRTRELFFSLFMNCRHHTPYQKEWIVVLFGVYRLSSRPLRYVFGATHHSILSYRLVIPIHH